MFTFLCDLHSWYSLLFHKAEGKNDRFSLILLHYINLKEKLTLFVEYKYNFIRFFVVKPSGLQGFLWVWYCLRPGENKQTGLPICLSPSGFVFSFRAFMFFLKLTPVLAVYWYLIMYGDLFTRHFISLYLILRLCVYFPKKFSVLFIEKLSNSQANSTYQSIYNITWHYSLLMPFRPFSN